MKTNGYQTDMERNFLKKKFKNFKKSFYMKEK